MGAPRLLAPTGDRSTDALLQRGVADFEKAFPGRVRGYYVVGSRADGSALPASDIDMRIIFKGCFVSESDCLRLYRKHIHGACRGQWHYSIPREDGDRRLLRHFCRQTLSFENHFLALYRCYLLGESACPHGPRRLQAPARLGEILYPEARAPLQALERDAAAQGQSALSQAAGHALQATTAAHGSPLP